jgi:hypothetical protein
MKTSRFSEQQIAFVLRQAEEGGLVQRWGQAQQHSPVFYQHPLIAAPKISAFSRLLYRNWNSAT